jgi:hypothetical protein
MKRKMAHMPNMTVIGKAFTFHKEEMKDKLESDFKTLK